MNSEDDNGGPRDIGDRTVDYSLRAVRLYQWLMKEGDSAGRVLAGQYLRSATSIGANLAEARSAESTPDFIHKLSIAQKEARESLYWLTLLGRSGVVPRKRIQPLVDETDELVSIITAMIVSKKARE
jgi:four helix bundle protein